MEPEKIKMIEQLLEHYDADAATIQNVVDLLNQNTQDIDAHRLYLEEKLNAAASIYLDIIMNEWKLIGGTTPLPRIYRQVLGGRVSALAKEYANEIIRYQQKEEIIKNDKTGNE
jgi:hypothetical protein